MNNDTKSALLNVTRQIIDEKGIGSVSMREVGRHAGLSRTASYRHFANKQSLLAAIVAEDFELLASRIAASVNPNAQPKEHLIGVLMEYFQFALDFPEHYHLMFNTRWDIEKFSKLKKAAEQVFQLAEDLVSETLKTNNESFLSAKKATAIVYSFIHGLVELSLAGHTEVEKGLDNPQMLINQFINALFPEGELRQGS